MGWEENNVQRIAPKDAHEMTSPPHGTSTVCLPRGWALGEQGGDRDLRWRCCLRGTPDPATANLVKRSRGGGACAARQALPVRP